MLPNADAARWSGSPDDIRLSTIVDETYDRARRTRTTDLRYELVTEDEALTEDRSWTIHWFPGDVFRALAAEAGLRVTLAQLDDEQQQEAILRPA